MKKMLFKSLALATLVSGSALLSGCMGFYDNTDTFMNGPETGMGEVEMISKYGTPAFAGDADGTQVYTYKVRDSKFIILVGLFDGYDLVVQCKKGKVVDTKRVERASTFTLFQPNLWGESFN
jgi:hypothetical protein